jgi:hypothetical protein
LPLLLRSEPMDLETPPPSAPRLAPVKEACRYGRFSHTKLYTLINASRVKAYKFDKRTLIDLDSIDAMYATLPPVTPNPNAK